MPATSVATAIRALRLPFVTASALPFCFGSLLAEHFAPWPFALGLAAVVCTHLAANLANDWADSRRGVDGRDPTYYGLFGGSKLIVTGVLSAGVYRNAALALAAGAAACVLAATFLFDRPLAGVCFAGILLLALGYSVGPLHLAWRRAGEATIFLLFGPATVAGADYLQTGTVSAAGALAGVPVGLLVAAILVANEVPDAGDDAAAGKRTLVGLIGARRGWMLYAALIAAAFVGVGVLVGMRIVSPWAMLALAAVPPAVAAAALLRRHPADKPRLVQASRLAILTQTLATLALIVATRL